MVLNHAGYTQYIFSKLLEDFAITISRLITTMEIMTAQDLSIKLARLEFLEMKRLEHIRKVGEYNRTAIGKQKHREAQKRYREKKKAERQ
jgi:hypothetical protein